MAEFDPKEAQQFTERLARAIGKTLKQLEKRQAIDQICQEEILQTIRRRYPTEEFSLCAEERTPTVKEFGTHGRFRWIIDPIDGTTNYTMEFPSSLSGFYAVAIGLEEDGEIIFSVVNLPEYGLLCSSFKGEGTYVNGEPARIQARKFDPTDRICTSHSVPVKTDKFPNATRLKCANATLASMLLNEVDAYVARNSRTWDMIATGLVKEAGGFVADEKSNPIIMPKGRKYRQLFAATATKEYHEQLIEHIIKTS